MKHLFVFFSLLLTWGSAQAQSEKQTPVTKLPGEENLSLRERAERDFLMPVRRKKVVVEAPKASIEDNTAAPETDATAHYAEATDEAAAMSARTARSYEVRHSEALAARRAAARREEARAEARSEARAEARAEARRAARHSSRSSRSSKAKSHKATLSHSSSKGKSSKSKVKAKSATHSSKSTSKSKSSKAKAKSTHSRSVKAKKSTAHKATKKITPSKTKSKTKHRR